MGRTYSCMIISVMMILSLITPLGISLSLMELTSEFTRVDLTVHEPIVIVGDGDFEVQAWPGNGSESNPYRIENLHITAVPNCVNIENTTVHFRISGCLLDGYTREAYSASLQLTNVSHGIVENCVMTGKRTAIAAQSVQYCSFSGICAFDTYSSLYIAKNSGFCNITENDFSSHAYHGIEIYDSHDIIIENNTVRDGLQFGIWIDRSPNCLVSNNTVLEFRWRGIFIEDSDVAMVDRNKVVMSPEPYAEYKEAITVKSSPSCVIANNTMSDMCDASLVLDRVTSVTVANNSMYNGVSILCSSSAHFSHIMTNNIVQGKPLLYSEVLANATLDGAEYGQIILVDAFNVSIVGGHFDDVSCAITIARSENCSIDSTSTIGCDFNSILIKYCSNISLIQIDISNLNGQGVRLADAKFTRVMNCTITDIRSQGNTNYGIAMGRSCEQSVIIGNEIHRVEDAGIRIGSSNVTIQGNTITNTLMGSLYFDSASGCTVTNNNMENGIQMAAWFLEETTHTFADNTVNGKQLGFICNANDFTMDGSAFGQVFLINCVNATIDNLATEKVVQGFVAINCTHISLEHATMSSVILDYHNEWHDLLIWDSSFCELIDVVINSATHGIGVFSSQNITLQDLSITETGYAIDIRSSQNITVRNSDFVNNRIGIIGSEVSNCIFTQNSVLNNLGGIGLLFSFDNVIYGNLIGFNTEYNAADEYGSNTWDNGIDSGNAWSDYSGTGDYVIQGSSGSVDRYPTILEAPATTSTPTNPPPTGSTTEPRTGDLSDFPLLYLTIAGVIAGVIIVIAIFMKRRE